MRRSQDSSSPAVPNAVRKARAATFGAFFLGGYTVAMWGANVTLIQGHAAISNSQYAFVAFLIGACAASGCILSGRLLDRWGSSRLLCLSGVLYGMSLLPVGFASGLVVLAISAAVMGLFRGAIDTSANAQGIEVERRYGRSIMLAFHAAWPAGGICGGLVASALIRVWPDSPAFGLTCNGIAVAALMLVIRRWFLPPVDETPAEAALADTAGNISQPSRGGLLSAVALGLLALCAMLGAEAASDWGGKFFHETLTTTTSFAALAYAFFSTGQFIGRLGGDALARRWGSARMVGVSGAVACCGLTVAIAIQSPMVSLLGFAFFGLGLAPIVPLMLATAGRLDPSRSGTNIGVVNMLGYAGLLVGPVAIGAVVSHDGLVAGLAIPAVLALLVAVIGPLALRNRTPNVTTVPQSAMRETSSTEG